MPAAIKFSELTRLVVWKTLQRWKLIFEYAKGNEKIIFTIFQTPNIGYIVILSTFVTNYRLV